MQRGALAVGFALAAGWALGAEDAPQGVVRPLDPVTNPTTPQKVALGAKLFTDVRLSVDGDLACASCHVAALAFTDGRRVALGRGGKELARNAPTLLNVGLVRELFHDGRAPSLEEQARAVLLNEDELGWVDAATFAESLSAIEDYGPLFEAAFGEGPITMQRTVRALAAFERTLLAGDSPFDRWWNGDAEALDGAAQRGYEVFLGRGGCAQCHSIRQSHATFSDGRFHNTGAGEGAGRTDRGREAVTGDVADRGAFRTPTLRNVELTAPYMHDGSLATLGDVIQFYVDGGRRNPQLSPLMRPLELDERDRADLLAFLAALTSPVLPQLDECEKLLAAGRPREALDLFREQHARDPESERAIRGIARAALALDEREPLLLAEGLARRRVHALSPHRAHDGTDEVARLLVTLGRVAAALAQHEEALAVARGEDALIAWSRVRQTPPPDPALAEDALLRETEWLEHVGRRDRAVELLEARLTAGVDSRALRERTAGVRYRRAWREFADGRPTDRSRGDMRRAAELLDGLISELSGESLLYRAYARHYLGATEAAAAAYTDAAADEALAERALQGLRNLLARDLDSYRQRLTALAGTRPDSPTVVLFRGYELLQQGDLDGAERLLRRRMEIETESTPGPHRHLAEVYRARGDRDQATDQYAVALTLGPGLRGLASEFESFIRSRPLDGFLAVDALVADYGRFLSTNPGDRRFQCLARNNLAFLLREVAASWTSRGPARIHTFPEGAPDDARRVARKCLRYYEEAVALIPDDVADLPFRERWIYAGVLNDTGLIHHYFAPLQDLARAEELYLRAFALTDGAYQDAYFYNLQFLYGFEIEGREERWFELADVARNAILAEDPESPTGFREDPVKRRAAQRDYERLAAALRR